MYFNHPERGTILAPYTEPHSNMDYLLFYVTRIIRRKYAIYAMCHMQISYVFADIGYLPEIYFSFI